MKSKDEDFACVIMLFWENQSLDLLAGRISTHEAVF